MDYRIEYENAKAGFVAKAEDKITVGEWIIVALIIPALLTWVYAIIGIVGFSL